MFNFQNYEPFSEHRFIRTITIVMLFTYFQLAFLNAYVVVYLDKDLLTSIFIISAIVSLRNILQLLFRIPLGELSQIIGRKPLILLGNLSFSLSLLFTFLATDWVLVLVAIILLGFGMSAFWPACFAYLGDVSDEHYGQNNGKMFQGMDIGLILSSILAIVLLDYLKLDLHTIFGIFFGLGFLFFLTMLKILPETLRSTRNIGVRDIFVILVTLTSSFKKMKSNLLFMTKKNILKRVFLLQFVISFTEFMITAFFPVLIVSKGYQKSTIAIMILVGTLLLIGIKPLLGKISDYFGFERPIMVFLFIACVGIISMAFFNDLVVLILIYAIISGSLLASYTAVNGAASKFSLNSEKGLALGVLGFWVSMGRASSTLFIGPVWEAISIGPSLALFASLILIFVVLYYFKVYRVKPLQKEMLLIKE